MSRNAKQKTSSETFSSDRSSDKPKSKTSTSKKNRAYLSVYFTDPADRDIVEHAASLFEMDVSPFIAKEMKRIAEKAIEKHEGKCPHCGSHKQRAA